MHSTVSRALRDDATIPPRTAERIKRLAAQMGYVPSAVARSLKLSRSRALGVVVTDIADPFHSGIVHSIEEVVVQAGYSLFLAASNRDTEREKAILHALAERRVEGVIICSSRISEPQLRELEKFSVPLVLVNNQIAGDFAHGIHHDDEWGGRAVTRHLLELGHRRIAYLGNREGGRASIDRQIGFESEMRLAGLPVKPEWLLGGPNGRPAGGMAGAQEWLQLHPRPTALFCFNDMMALGALKGFKQAGVRIPEDCSLAGFDDVFVAEYADPPLTTLAQPKDQLGREAAELMFELLKSGPTEWPRVKSVRGRLVVRASTARPIP